MKTVLLGSMNIGISPLRRSRLRPIFRCFREILCDANHLENHRKIEQTNY